MNKFEKFELLIEELKKEAIEDFRIAPSLDDCNKNFNFINLSIKWLDKSVYYKKLLHSKKQQMKVLYKNLYNKYYKENIIYQNLSDKNFKTIVESDSDYQFHEKELFFIQTIFDYCIEIKESLKAKTWEIKEMLSWEKYKNGE